MANIGVLTPGQEIKPKLDEKTAVDLVRRLYGFTVKKISELNAYDDKNYHVICEKQHSNPHVSHVDEHGYVLKILNSLDSRNVALVEAQNEMMLYLSERDIRCTVPVKNLRGSFNALENFANEGSQGHVVRLLIYQPGLTLYSVQITPCLLEEVGYFVARLDTTLVNFSHPAIKNRSSLWMLSSVPKIRDFIYAITKDDDKAMINEVVDVFEEKVLRLESELDHGIIHGDLNEQNLLVDSQGTRIMAVIDFGDCHSACLIYELAIAVCYMLIQTRELNAAKFVIDGYRTIKKLTRSEKSILKICVCARLCQSLTLGAYSHMKDPQNDYLLVTQKPGWDVLKKLWPMKDDEVAKIWGLEDS